MIFVETPVFTRRLRELLTDDDYTRLQLYLLGCPWVGDLIEGTGGLRKVRVPMPGRGKRGGARVIYYHFVPQSRIAMLFIYAKNEKDDLTADQRATLRKIVEQWEFLP